MENKGVRGSVILFWFSIDYVLLNMRSCSERLLRRGFLEGEEYPCCRTKKHGLIEAECFFLLLTKNNKHCE